VAQHTDDAGFIGEGTDLWSYTQVRDWILLTEGVPRTARHLYLILRSMLQEKRATGLRRMTVDQICWLLPGVNGKPISKRAAQNAIQDLLDANLITCADPDDYNGPRLYKVRDMPPEGYQGWRNAWDKLDAYVPNWRTQTPVPEGCTNLHPSPDPAQEVAQGVQKTAGGAQKSARGVQKNVIDPSGDLGKLRALRSFSKKIPEEVSLSKPLSHAAGAPAGAGPERDAAAPFTPSPALAGGQGAGEAATEVSGAPWVPPDGPLWFGEEESFSGSPVSAARPSPSASPSMNGKKNRSSNGCGPPSAPGGSQGASRGPGKVKSRKCPPRAAVRALRALDDRIGEPLAKQLAGAVDPRWSESDLLKHLRACYSPERARSPKALLEKIIKGLPEPVVEDPMAPKERVRLDRRDRRHQKCPVCQGTQREEDLNGKLTGFWCENPGHYGENWLDPMRYWKEFRPGLSRDQLAQR
jgi:hypothetical protein